MKLKIVASTDVGSIRDHNEDNYQIISDLGSNSTYNNNELYELQKFGALLIVADGMGGEAAGEVASKIATVSIAEYLKEKIISKDKTYLQIIEILNNSLVFAHEQIIEYVKDHSDSFGMGTTAIVGLIYDNHLFIAWVGDSRAYRYSQNGRITSHNYFSGNLEILTNDHSLVWGEVVKGNMTPEQARVSTQSNIITQSLGDIYKKPKPESNIFPIYQDDIIMLCSDGLNGMISDKQIENIFTNDTDISNLSKELISQANNNGGHDNITITLCKIVEGEIFKSENENETSDIENKKEKPKNNFNSSPIKKERDLKSILVILSFLAISFLAVIFFRRDNNTRNEEAIPKYSQDSIIEKEISDSVNTDTVYADSIYQNNNDSDIETYNEDKNTNVKIKNITKNRSHRHIRKKVTKGKKKMDVGSTSLNKKFKDTIPALPTNNSILKKNRKLDDENNSIKINRQISKNDLQTLFKTLPKKYKNKSLLKIYRKLKKDIKSVNKTDTTEINNLKRKIYKLITITNKK